MFVPKTYGHNMEKRLLFCLLFAAFSFSEILAQQPWTRAKGKFYAQIGTSYLQATSLLNGSADPIPLHRDVTDITLQAYGEYGFTNRLMLSGSLPLKILSVKNGAFHPLPDEGSMVALSNIQAGLTWRFFKKQGWVVSGKTGFGLPTAKFDSKTGLRSGFDAVSVSPSIMAGLGHSKFFTSAEIGYVLRSNGYSNRVFANFQIGKPVGKRKRLMPILALEFMKSGTDGTFNDGTGRSTGLYLDRQSYFSPQLKLGFKARPKIWLWASAGGGLGDVTNNVAASPGFSFSIGYER